MQPLPKIISGNNVSKPSERKSDRGESFCFALLSIF